MSYKDFKLEVDALFEEKLKNGGGQWTDEEKQRYAEISNKYGFKRITKQYRAPVVFGKRKVGAENNWETIDLKKYEFTKPVLVCLSGNGAVNLSESNGFCKRAEKFLELMFQGRSDSSNPEDFIDIVGCRWGALGKSADVPSSIKSMDELYDYARLHPDNCPVSKNQNTGDISNEEVKLISDSILLSRCLQNNEKIDIDEAKRRISQVTFMTYCYGSTALKKIIESFNQSLKQYGYDDNEIKAINSAMKQVSFARQDMHNNIIPSVYFYSYKDLEVSQRKISMSEEMLKEQGSPIYLEYIDKDSAEAYGLRQEFVECFYEGVVVDDFLTNPDAEKPNHNITVLDRDGDWNCVDKRAGTLNAVSQMMAWSLCRCVENSLQNAKSDKYISNDMNKLSNELLSIRQSFTAKELMSME